eukprot:TRINITY_DN58984_c0_g1_i1.p1 TRINITY_DN58984_c0_g1~~TRINITY_DN58984_c0_g1_i1.p1  ORF type:complete len:116 (+),score=24.05 TRINITY_DN58984_c0_g1_i1:31-348(+)
MTALSAAPIVLDGTCLCVGGCCCLGPEDPAKSLLCADCVHADSSTSASSLDSLMSWLPAWPSFSSADSGEARELEGASTLVEELAIADTVGAVMCLVRLSQPESA